MNRCLAVVVVLLIMTPIVASISCYVGYGGSYATTSGFDVCYSWTSSGVAWKSGVSGYTCSSNVPSGYSCCSTDLCNGAKINGMSILMVSLMGLFALYRAI